MCGIVGVLYRDRTRPCAGETIDAMRDIISYRGPDDSGTRLDGALGLGHRRLSIIDLGGGHQPMQLAGQNLWIVFNGEIYNYREQRDRLSRHGARFETNSDTEVILHLYAEKGPECVHALNGMFAFAIWDGDRRTLFIARDRMGVKPLYYSETRCGFVFASEIKSILASGMVESRCREEGLAEYLVFRQTAGTETLFRGIKSLAPGCTLTLRDDVVTISRYWSPLPTTTLDITYDDARVELRRLLQDSVRLRLVSDVPVGTFCSGGVDSSLVTALAVRQKSEQVNTFSIGFDDPAYDESQYALRVSKKYRTTHHQLCLNNDEFSQLLPKMVWHNDEPLDFANSVHIFALSRLAKQFVTVVLTGEGSDELFAGYPRYRIPEFVRAYRWVPAWLRAMVRASVSDHRLAKLDRYATRSDEEVLQFNSSYIEPAVARDVCPRLPSGDLHYRHERLLATAGLGVGAVRRASLLDQETFLVSILHRQDKMSMAASIESRVPFMDYRIVEFANQLPRQYKIKGRAGKVIVKDVAREFLPADIVDRRKSGFGVPLTRWFRESSGLGERIRQLADRPDDVFDGPTIRRMVDEHRSGTHDHAELLWTALNVQLWREAFRC
jgi:asparagine synthase (glutamine-hydrolysing)